jgi:hypothetical protein
VLLHTMPIAEQLALLQRTRVMVGINGGQINALFFLPAGSTLAAIFAMRWTDQNFGPPPLVGDVYLLLLLLLLLLRVCAHL